MAGKKGVKHYPKELKLEAMRLYYEEGMVQSEITKRLEIRDPNRIKKWLRQYREEGSAAFSKKPCAVHSLERERELFSSQ